MANKIAYELTTDCKGDKRTSNYRVKNDEIANIVYLNFIRLGYQIVTFSEKVRELEKGNHTVIITKEK